MMQAVELRTLPGANLSGVGATIFRVDYKTAPAGSSFVNANDGQKITANPATNADYLDHAKAPGAKGLFSPGVRSDGSGF